MKNQITIQSVRTVYIRVLGQAKIADANGDCTSAAAFYWVLDEMERTWPILKK